MPKKLDEKIGAVLARYEMGADSCWDCHGVWVVYHKAVEEIAARAGVTFGPPQIIQADAEKKIVAVCATGTLGDRSEWSIGEAAPYNNKNAYPYAMAEKRAKDRVVLKLVGLHGLVYSEDEADDFKNQGRADSGTPAAGKPSPEASAKARTAEALTGDPRMIPVELDEHEETDWTGWCATMKATINKCEYIPQIQAWWDANEHPLKNLRIYQTRKLGKVGEKFYAALEKVRDDRIATLKEETLAA